MYQYRATIVRVVDGDTVHADVDLGFDSHQLMTLRLAGINAPELATIEGKAAKDALTQLLHPSVPPAAVPFMAETPVLVILETIKDRREKYGRYLGSLWPDDGRANRGPSINEQMVTLGHAVPYDGGKR